MTHSVLLLSFSFLHCLTSMSIWGNKDSLGADLVTDHAHTHTNHISLQCSTCETLEKAGEHTERHLSADPSTSPLYQQKKTKRLHRLMSQLKTGERFLRAGPSLEVPPSPISLRSCSSEPSPLLGSSRARKQESV